MLNMHLYIYFDFILTLAQVRITCGFVFAPGTGAHVILLFAPGPGTDAHVTSFLRPVRAQVHM